MNPRLSITIPELAAFCEAYCIRRYGVFGSALRSDFDAESDIDVLVEFVPGHTPGLPGMAGLEIELSELFGGQKVDLRTPEDLSCYFRQEVIDKAEVLYEQE